MKKSVYRLVVLLLLSCLTGCYQAGTPKANGLEDAYLIVSTNVPFATHSNASQFDRASVIEWDDYGRRYIQYITHCSHIDRDVEINLICQKTENDYTYYYQDYCYIVRDVGTDQFNEDQIALLKKRNDWNEPLNEEKMSRISMDEGNPKIMYEEIAADALVQYLSLDESYGAITRSMEMIGNNKQLYYGYTFLRDGDDEGKSNQFYLFICADNEDNPIMDCEEIEFTFDCQDLVSAFRISQKNS